MAGFIAKQMVGNQLKSVKDSILKGALGDDDKKEETAGDGDEDPEVAEARREAEQKRIEKHRKMEEERENVRQSIRDKYGLKKKVPGEENMQPPEDAGRIGRKKKTPAELAAEANADSDDEDTLSKFSSLCCCMNFV